MAATAFISHLPCSVALKAVAHEYASCACPILGPWQDSLICKPDPRAGMGLQHVHHAVRVATRHAHHKRSLLTTHAVGDAASPLHTQLAGTKANHCSRQVHMFKALGAMGVLALQSQGCQGLPSFQSLDEIHQGHWQGDDMLNS